MRNHQKTFTMLLVLVLIGLNMRPLLTSVGPLLPQLRQASGMSFSVAALLTALPVVTMGGLALAGSWLHQHVSERVKQIEAALMSGEDVSSLLE